MRYEARTTRGILGMPGRSSRSLVAAAVVGLLACSGAVGGGAAAAQSAAADEQLQLSLEHYQAGRYREAIAAARAALEADPNSPGAYNNMAVSYLGLGMFDEGIRDG